MAEPIIPPKAKLFIGVLFKSEKDLEETEKILNKKFGEIDFQSQIIPFTHTNYYDKIGTGLFKMLYSFKKLVKRDSIADIKLYTNKIEKKISSKEKRSVNIDPGYLTLSNVYLATCKEFFHRVYLKKGVYLENEYKYVAKQFEPWEWTYPDYRKPEYLYFFHHVRRLYYNQLQSR